ncbi:MAG: phosphopantetheine-binding protein [Eubacteriales bacterium]
MREEIIQILTSIKAGVDYEQETRLIDARILDSLAIIALVSELSFAFDIEIDVMDLVPENLNSVDAMVCLVEELQE